MNRIFSGVQPTGNLHLGNYLGAIRNWVKLQDDFECIFCVVDLHALTVRQDPAELRHNTREIAAAFLAAGVSPDRCTIFIQSAVSAHSELAWLLSCQTPMGWLNRMTQFKEKAGKKRDLANLGLYAYPVLMAADILAYKATHVPVGEDQKQHLELARDIAQAFNHHYGVDFFPLPEPQILGATPRVMSLRDGSKKMSKSDPAEASRINLTDDADTIAAKIRKAKTDPEPLPDSVAALESRPEASNLLRIFSALSETSLESVVETYAGQTFSDFKKGLTNLAVEKVAPIGAEMRRLLDDPSALDALMSRGNKAATERASTHLAEIHEILGILRLAR